MTTDLEARTAHWRRRVICASDLDRIEEWIEDALEPPPPADDEEDGTDIGVLALLWRGFEAPLDFPSALIVLNQACDLFPHPLDIPLRDAARERLEALVGGDDAVEAADVRRLARELITGDPA